MTRPAYLRDIGGRLYALRESCGLWWVAIGPRVRWGLTFGEALDAAIGR